MYSLFFEIFFFFIIYNMLILTIGLFIKLSEASRLIIKSLYIKFYIFLLFFLFFFIFLFIVLKFKIYGEFFLFFSYFVNVGVFYLIIFFVLTFLFFFFFVKFNFNKILPFFLCLSFVLFSNILYIFVEDFFSLYIVLEFHTLLLYVLYNITLPGYSSFYVKNGIKFFILSVFTSLFFLLGLFFVYYATGTIVFYEMKVIMNNSSNLIYNIGLNLIYAVFAFKLGLFPFYLWMLEIFGILNNVFFIIYIFIAKIPIFFILIKLVYFLNLTVVLYILSFFSVLYGIFCVFIENDFRLFIIYSSMVQYGTLILTLTGANIYVYYGILYSYLNYILIFNLFFFLVLFCTRGKNFDLKVFASMKSLSFLWVFILLVCLFSVIGVPPTLGFFGKYYLYYGLLLTNSYYLVLYLILTSLFSSVYYFNIIRLIFFTPTKDMGIFLYKIPHVVSVYGLFILIIISLLYFFF